jgi:hypothetical protein
MLQIEKMRINLRNKLKLKNKTKSINLLSDNDNKKENLSKNTEGPVPLLTDMEFNWIDDY